MVYHFTLFFTLALLPSLLFPQRLVPTELMVPIANPLHGDMTVYNDLLIVGSRSNVLNGDTVSSIVAFDGVVSTQIPSIFDENGSGYVKALSIYEGQLIAAGRTATLHRVVSWNGAVWENMGPVLPSRVTGLIVYEGALLATCANGTVMRWSGASWQQLGLALNSSIDAIEIHDERLYIGGVFTGTVGGNATLHRIARWTGSEWSSVENGFSGRVLCLKSDVLGLLIGGEFGSNADSTAQFPNCARFVDGALTTIPGAIKRNRVTSFFRLPDGRLHATGAVVDGLELSAQPLKSVWYNGDFYVLSGIDVPESWRRTGGLTKLIDGTTTTALDQNSIAASVSPHPSSFYRWWAHGQKGFETPKGDRTHTVQATSPWVSGMAEGTLHRSIPMYDMESMGRTQKHAGPRGTNMDDAFYERYHRVWKLDRAMIAQHISNWSSPGYTMPEAIASWPGNGDPSNDEPLRVAPFRDLNGNDIYEPQMGEYPLIKGTHAVYSIQHTEADGGGTDVHAPFPLDLHVMQYSFDADNDATDHTVFINYQFVNRSQVNYDSVRFAQFCDLDIGDPCDDHSGCDSTRRLLFTYNADDVDDTCSEIGYGSSPPAQGVRFLNTAMRSHRLYIPEYAWTASIDDLFYGLSQGAPFTQLGYPTHFEFPGGAWQESLRDGYSRAQVGGAGPFMLAAGDTLCIDLAYIYARSWSGSALASVDALKMRSDSIQAFYDVQDLGCNSYPAFKELGFFASESPIALYPNPATDQFTLASSDPLEQVSVFDMQGRSMFSISSGAYALVISTDRWASGAYIVRVSGTKVTRTARLLKQ